MRPYDFVQAVWYEQTKTYLDFHPYDDKYKEVIMQANLLLPELQREEDWTWLRDKWIMGDTRHFEFTMPDFVYKACMGFNDAVRLHLGPIDHDCTCGHGDHIGPIPQPQCCHNHSHCHHRHHQLAGFHTEIPFVYASSINTLQEDTFTPYGNIYQTKLDLFASTMGKTIVFNRPFFRGEQGILETDVILKLEPLHICSDACYMDKDGNIDYSIPCRKIEDEVWPMVPDNNNFMILRTAAIRAEAEPAWSELAMNLNDRAQKAMSHLRTLDAEHTRPSLIKQQDYGHVSVY